MLGERIKVKIWSYGEYASGNYGSHCQAVQIGNLTLYFSYDTIVGFNGIVRENMWGPTTGKHLNWLQPDKSRRLKDAEFERQLQEELAKHNLLI